MNCELNTSIIHNSSFDTLWTLTPYGRIDHRWYAINTSKGETIEMPKDFSPDKISPPNNTPIRFPSYPEITFLFRKISKNYSDNIQDNSLIKLMNIYRSGENNRQSFLWSEYEKI